MEGTECRVLYCVKPSWQKTGKNYNGDEWANERSMLQLIIAIILIFKQFSIVHIILKFKMVIITTIFVLFIKLNSLNDASLYLISLSIKHYIIKQ